MPGDVSLDLLVAFGSTGVAGNHCALLRNHPANSEGIFEDGTGRWSLSAHRALVARLSDHLRDVLVGDTANTAVTIMNFMNECQDLVSSRSEVRVCECVVDLPLKLELIGIPKTIETRVAPFRAISAFVNATGQAHDITVVIEAANEVVDAVLAGAFVGEVSWLSQGS